MRPQIIAALVVASLDCASAQEPGFEFERWCEAVSVIACDSDACRTSEVNERVTIAFNVERNGELCINGACNPFSILSSGPDRFSNSIVVEGGAYPGEWQLTVAINRYSFVLARPMHAGISGWSGRCGVNS